MFLDENDIINKNDFEKIEDKAICSICNGIIFEPVECINCNNCFCNSCIEKWNKQNKTCPFKCTNFKFRKCEKMNNLLSILIFKCKNGCNEKIPYLELNEHCKKNCVNQSYKIKYLELKKKVNKLKNENNALKNHNEINNDFQIKINRHEHPLVLVKTLRPFWICNNCLLQFEEERSYYCSVCDFDLCIPCLEDELLNN